jgi:pimeloyl-ACP methyl ester carboxylesterase
MASAQACVILVHGLWMSGLEFALFKQRIEANYNVTAVPFAYPSTSRPMDEHVASLREFVQKRRETRIHFVGHSLGGLVVLRLLENHKDIPPGRAVLMGSPLQGCSAARGFASWPFGKAFLGKAICEETVARKRIWSGSRDVGVIAGSLNLGFGRFFSDDSGDSDGTVLVSETHLQGAADHIVLPVSHTGMLFSNAVVAQATHFLDCGSFSRATVAQV